MREREKERVKRRKRWERDIVNERMDIEKKCVKDGKERAKKGVEREKGRRENEAGERGERQKESLKERKETPPPSWQKLTLPLRQNLHWWQGL